MSYPESEGLAGGGLLSATGDEAGRAASDLDAPSRPEVSAGLAFAGGLLAAIVLKRLAS